VEATIDIRTADGNVNILLEEAQVGAIREVLVDLCLSTMAEFSMLIDAAGRVVASGGETAAFDTEAIAALAAGDLATTRQLARMLGEPEFALLFQHEKQKNLFMTAVENDSILIVVFDVETTFGALRLRIRRSISQLQQILHQARKNTVVSLASTSDATRKSLEEKEEEHEGSAESQQAPAPADSSPAQPVPAGATGLPEQLAGDVRKAVAWFDGFKGWEVMFRDEVTFMRNSLTRNRPEEVENVRMTLVRTRARLTEQKRLLEAKFRMVQSLYQQFLTALHTVMLKAWTAEVVDRAMKAAMAGAGAKFNMISGGAQKNPDGAWTLEFGAIGKQMVVMCHAREMNYQEGVGELLRQLNASLMALSAFLAENARLRDELIQAWARVFHHYAEGLKTLDLESEALELFRPLVRPGQMPKA